MQSDVSPEQAGACRVRLNQNFSRFLTVASTSASSCLLLRYMACTVAELLALLERCVLPVRRCGLQAAAAASRPIPGLCL